MTDQPASGIDGDLRPGIRLGILGGGQLARMTALAAANLGIASHIYAPEADSPAFDVTRWHTLADYDDETALRAFGTTVDAITYEFENVPVETAEILARVASRTPLRPGLKALSITQDRLLEKTFIQGQHCRTAPVHAVDTLADIEAGLAVVGMPAILKTRRFGYDGKGQMRINAVTEAAVAWQAIGRQPAILEGFVAFEREVSVLVARTAKGRCAAYDICENEHRNHILATTTLPARLSTTAAAEASAAATRLAEALDYVGVMAVEVFVTANDSIIINEIAPRVHNSGHWTIEGAETSQFEQHVRAVMGLPLGSTARRGVIQMRNILGEDMHEVAALLAEPGAHLHLYGKGEAREGRKMGHVTVVRPAPASG